MVFGLLEKDVLCATMAVTTTMGVDLGFSWVFLGVFPFDFLSYSCYSERAYGAMDTEIELLKPAGARNIFNKRVSLCFCGE